MKPDVLKTIPGCYLASISKAILLYVAYNGHFIEIIKLWTTVSTGSVFLFNPLQCIFPTLLLYQWVMKWEKQSKVYNYTYCLVKRVFTMQEYFPSG